VVMGKRYYGEMPKTYGVVDVQSDEMMAYLYLPVKMPNSESFILEDRLKFVLPILNIIKHADDLTGKYVYLTVKNIFCTKDNPGNRPGCHSDGFLTDDINYIWYDKEPTVFYHQPFKVGDDHIVSMEQFERQANENCALTYEDKSLLRLDQYVVHRPPAIKVPGMRLFIKVSISDEKYNLIGNTHNYLIDYDWKMYSRNQLRNHPIYKERDYYKEDEINDNDNAK